MSDPTDELYDDMRRIAGTANGIDPRIYRLIDEAERRANNASDTIGRYQQLTKTDYPGTLERHIELGRVVVNG